MTSHDRDPNALVRAMHMLELRRAAEALPLAQQAALSNPDDLEALGTVCRCHLELGELDQAAAAARRAIAAAPDHPWPHSLHAAALSGSGRPKDAVRAQAEAVRLAPDSAEMMSLLATLLADDKQPAEAREAVERARNMEPGDPTIAVRESYVALAARRWADAEASARRALEARPDDPSALNNLAVSLERQGRRAEAIDLYARSAAEDPRGIGAENTRDAARRLAGIGGITVLGVLLFVGLRPLAMAGLDSLPDSWEWPVLGVGLAVVAAIIVATERSKKREHAQLSDHGQRLVDDAKRQDLQERRLAMRRSESIFVTVLIGCAVGSAIALLLGGARATPFVVVAGILAAIMALSIWAGRMAEDE